MGPMTNNNGTITSTYQAIATGYAVPFILDYLDTERIDTLSDRQVVALCNEVNSHLHRKAEGLAPRFAEECAETGCTNLRPGADAPRRQAAWDLVAEAHTWNMLCDLEQADHARQVIARLLDGEAVTLAWNHGVLQGAEQVVVTPAPEAPVNLLSLIDPETAEEANPGERWAEAPAERSPCHLPHWTNPETGRCEHTDHDAPCEATPPCQDSFLPECLCSACRTRLYGGPEAERSPRHTHTDAEGNRYETYSTPELRPGDVVTNMGALILLVDHAPVEHHLPGVYAAHGYVLNAAEDNVRNTYGNLLYLWDDHYSCHAARWTVQGNDRATWQVLASGPRRTDALFLAHTTATRQRDCGVAPWRVIHFLETVGYSLELSLAVTTLAYGTDPSRLPEGVLRRHEDASTYTAKDFLSCIHPDRKAHLA